MSIFCLGRHIPGRIAPLLSLLWITIATSNGEPDRSDSPADLPTLAVYLPDYRAKEADASRLFGTTDLILFSAEPKGDGTIDFSRITSELLAAGKNAKSENGISVSVCVGGWGRGDAFASAVSNKANRKRFVDDLVSFCSKNDLDGVDIDWEFPKGDKEHADLTLFLAGLSAKLRAEERQLTIALGYSRPLPPECWPHIDRVYLMSYQPWSVEPYEKWLEESVTRFLATGLPPEKLILGVGFYTKEKAGERRTVSWRNLTADHGAAFPKSDHGYWPVGKEASDLRLRLMRKHGLGGVMAWEYGHDSIDPKQSLLRHLSAGIGLLTKPQVTPATSD